MSAYDTPDPIKPQPWQVDALCAQVDPEIFHPGPGEDQRPALAICSRCPVTTQCLNHALATEGGARYGIWGGTTPNERHQLAAGQQPKRHREAAEATA